MVPNRKKNILISCAVLLILSCIILCLILTVAVGASLVWPIDFRQPVLPVLPEEDTFELPELENDQVLTPDDDLPSEFAETIFQIESQVITLRGLELTEPVERVLISPEELNEIVVNDFFSEYTDEDARNDVLILSTLGLVPEDFDLLGFYQDLYSEQIAGFYDREEETIYVVQIERFGGREKLTYAHEFTHVLQDQTFDFSEGLNYNEEACEVDSERCAAIQALIEGDATLTEIQWFQTYATRQDYFDLMEAFDSYESPMLDAAPPYIAADLYFPYEKGLAFVEYLYDLGGYDAIDAAYLDPPKSTTEILHPELYPDHQPVTVILPDLEALLDEGWYLYDENIMGEWYTYLILSQAYEEAFRLEETRAEDAAAGWAGDAYAFYLNEDSDDVVFLLDTYWETSTDAETFAEAFIDYADSRWPGSELSISGYPAWFGADGVILLMQEGSRTVWLMAPSEAMITLILPEFQP